MVQIVLFLLSLCIFNAMKNNKLTVVNMSEAEREFMAVKKAVQCSVCRQVSYLFPKGVGLQPYIWEMNCEACHLYNLAVNGYYSGHEELFKQLRLLRDQFLAGRSSAELQSRINSMAEEFDGILDNRYCECGGCLSIAAQPKCVFCDIEIFNSYFHYSDQSYTK